MVEKKDFVYYDNTYGVLKKLNHDVVLTERIVETILQIFFLFYYAYLIYNNVNSFLYLIIYSCLSTVSIIYFIFYVIGLVSDNKYYKKRVKPLVKRIVTVIKYMIRIFTIVVAFVEMYKDPISDFERIINIVSLVSLGIQIAVSIISHFVSKYIDLFITSIKMDYEKSKISEYVNKGERIANDGIKGSILGFINEKAGLSDPEDNEVIKPSLSKEELKQRKNVEDIANKYLEDERLSREEKRKERILHQREKLEQETSRFKEGLKRINIFRKN